MRFLYFFSPPAAALGLLLSGVGLVRLQGWPRAVGQILVVGVMAIVTVGVVVTFWRVAMPGHVAFFAVMVAIVGDVGVGWLAVAGKRAVIAEG